MQKHVAGHGIQPQSLRGPGRGGLALPTSWYSSTGSTKEKQTGETFNGEGKSDIIIRQGGANVFIAECKIWEGVTAFTAAIDQLQRYVTWRDTKTALIIFNRNKGFSDVIQKAQEAVRAHPQYKSRPAGPRARAV